MLTRDAILASDDLPRKKVEVKEWGGHVFVRSMTGAERDKFESDLFDAKGRTNHANIRARLVVLTVVDSKGDRLFDAKDADDLGKKSAAALDRVFAVAQKLNGLSASDVEDLAKN